MIISENGVITPEDLPFEISGQVDNVRSVHFSSDATLKEQLRVFEIAAIKQAIEVAGGDRKAAAANLGIGLSSLYRKLEEHQLQSEDNETA